MSRLLQVLHEDGLTCPVLVERVRGAPGRSINWLGSVLARVRSQYPEVGSDVFMSCHVSCRVFRLTSGISADLSTSGAWTRSSTGSEPGPTLRGEGLFPTLTLFTLSNLRSLLPVYNSLMAFKQFLFRNLPEELEQLGTVAR